MRSYSPHRTRTHPASADNGSRGKETRLNFILVYCNESNLQTEAGRKQCEKVCDRHFCCFHTVTNGYECQYDDSVTCDEHSACPIILAGLLGGFEGMEAVGGGGALSKVPSLHGDNGIAMPPGTVGFNLPPVEDSEVSPPSIGDYSDVTQVSTVPMGLLGDDVHGGRYTAAQLHEMKLWLDGKKQKERDSPKADPVSMKIGQKMRGGDVVAKQHSVRSYNRPDPIARCYDLLHQSDANSNDDRILQNYEYTNFIADLSEGDFDFENYDDMPFAFKISFTFLSCYPTFDDESNENGGDDCFLGPESGVDIAGTGPQEVPKPEEEAFLQLVCEVALLTVGLETYGMTPPSHDDVLTLVPLRPFGLRLSNLPSASPVLLALSEPLTISTIGDGVGLNAAAIRALSDFILDLGTRAFSQSQAYGERFEEWDVGNIWSLGEDGMNNSDELVFSTSSDTLPLAEMSRMPSDDAGVGDGILDIFDRRRRLLEDAPLDSTAVLTMVHESTVTFKDMYWEGAPEPQELTEYLVREINSDANRGELLKKLRPLACGAKDVTAGECDIEVEVVSRRSIVIVVDDSVIVVDDDGAQGMAMMEDGGGSVEPKPPVDSTGGTNGGEGARNPSDIDTTRPQGVHTTEDDLIFDDAPLALDTNFGEQMTDPVSEPTSPDDLPTDPSIGTGDNGNPSDLGTGHADVDADYVKAKPLSKGVRAGAQELAVKGSDGGSYLKTNNPAVVAATVFGAALFASLVAILLYRRKSNRRRAAAADGDWPVRGDHSSLSSEATAKCRESTIDCNDPVVLSAKSLCGGSWAPVRGTPPPRR